jgi:hypothetical protein
LGAHVAGTAIVTSKTANAALAPRAHTQSDAFRILGISRSKGTELVRNGVINVVYYSETIKRITDDEISRILREGLVNRRRIIRRPTR